MDPASDALMHELDPSVGALLTRHHDTAKEWFPHALVPYSRGRDFVEGEEWTADDAGPPEAVRSALLVNILTEDNLPYYYHSITGFGLSEAWQEWSRRWTAEEGRHAIVIRDYLTVTRAIDPVALERARMHQVSGGVVPDSKSAADGLTYVSLQELATRIAHRNTGQQIDDPAGTAIMSRVAADENLHYLFYRDLASTALEIDASTMVLAIDRQVRNFAMPGTGIVDFEAHARLIAAAGIYDFSQHHDQILVPVVLRHWKLETLEGLSPEAEEARVRVLAFIERLGKVAKRIAARKAERLAATPA
ncbi:MAG: acyl-ACP desaturase [Acidimicrobiia bacterium]